MWPLPQRLAKFMTRVAHFFTVPMVNTGKTDIPLYRYNFSVPVRQIFYHFWKSGLFHPFLGLNLDKNASLRAWNVKFNALIQRLWHLGSFKILLSWCHFKKSPYFAVFGCKNFTNLFTGTKIFTIGIPVYWWYGKFSKWATLVKTLDMWSTN